ncbi:MAG: helix-turn-helix transcriptional regulator [Gemmatimonadetes bacterium]|nr:helix-turn-helix transcriptional regulator [Gemmatimonadota bacterium]
MHAPERLLAATDDVRVGTFRCPVAHPDFATAGAIEGYTVAFPRTAVWIEHADKPAFVADPGRATIYNRGQPYRRRPLAPDGDRVEWFSVSEPLARALVAELHPEAAAAPGGPFPVPHAPVPAALYWRQRLVATRIAARQLHDTLALEQAVTLIVGAVLRAALPDAAPPSPPPLPQRELVERVREVLARDPLARHTVRTIAAAVGTSPWHLCRVFRSATGTTLHHHLLDLRARLALEQVADAASLSRLACQLGFSSHSHFTAEFRRRFGSPPSRVRAVLTGRHPAAARRSADRGATAPLLSGAR